MAPARTELDVQRGRGTVYTLLAHLVFVANHRRPVFNWRDAHQLRNTSRQISA